jgi:Haemolysin-III related
MYARVRVLNPVSGAGPQSLAVFGAVVNVLRIPEKWFCPNTLRGLPFAAGPFDYWLNSHQVMHIAVVFALYHYHAGATCDYHHFISLNGVCQ